MVEPGIKKCKANKLPPLLQMSDSDTVVPALSPPKNYTEFLDVFLGTAGVSRLADVLAQDIESHLMDLESANMIALPYWSRRVGKDIQRAWLVEQNKRAGEDSESAEDTEDDVKTEERLIISSDEEILALPAAVLDDSDDEFSLPEVPDNPPESAAFVDPMRLMRKADVLLDTLNDNLNEASFKQLREQVADASLSIDFLKAEVEEAQVALVAFGFGTLIGFSTIIALLGYLCYK